MIDSLDELDKARERRFATRSEAARYAARVRWGNRGAAETPAEKPPAQTETSPLGSRCKDAMERHAKAGFTVEVIDGPSFTGTKQGELEDAWITTMAPVLRSAKYGDVATRDNMGQKAISMMGSSKAESMLVLRHESGAIAGVALLYQSPVTGQVKIEYAATSGIMKGSGSALFGHIVNHAASRGSSELTLSAIPTAVSFWGEMGFVAYGKDAALTKMGMPSKVFSQLVSELP